MFKPTGPDGLGWGDLRKCTPGEELILKDLLKLEDRESRRKEKLLLDQTVPKVRKQVVVEEKPVDKYEHLDEDERWEAMLREQT